MVYFFPIGASRWKRQKPMSGDILQPWVTGYMHHMTRCSSYGWRTSKEKKTKVIWFSETELGIGLCLRWRSRDRYQASSLGSSFLSLHVCRLTAAFSLDEALSRIAISFWKWYFRNSRHVEVSSPNLRGCLHNSCRSWLQISFQARVESSQLARKTADRNNSIFPGWWPSRLLIPK